MINRCSTVETQPQDKTLQLDPGDLRSLEEEKEKEKPRKKKGEKKKKEKEKKDMMVAEEEKKEVRIDPGVWVLIWGPVSVFLYVQFNLRWTLFHHHLLKSITDYY